MSISKILPNVFDTVLI